MPKKKNKVSQKNHKKTAKSVKIASRKKDSLNNSENTAKVEKPVADNALEASNNEQVTTMNASESSEFSADLKEQEIKSGNSNANAVEGKGKKNRKKNQKLKKEEAVTETDEMKPETVKKNIADEQINDKEADIEALEAEPTSSDFAENNDVFSLTDEEKKAIDARKTKKRRIIGIASVALLIGLFVFYFYVPKFQNVVVEAGSDENVVMDDFLISKYYRPFSKMKNQVPWHFTDKVGEMEVELSFLGHKETVKLSVVDTTPPEVVFKNARGPLGYELKVEDFIESYHDVSEVVIEFGDEVPDTSYYQLSKINVIVKDIYGNETAGTCELLITWLKSDVTIEIGSDNVAAQLVFDASKASDIPAEEIAKINVHKLGDYYISFVSEEMPLEAHVTVVDTTPPTVKLKSISVYDDDTRRFSYKDFITSISDNSGEYSVTMSEIDYKHLGDQTVTITAVDPSGNKTVATTVYNRHKDTKPPVISGLSTITIKKHSSYDWSKGVSAYDEKDGNVSVTITSNTVNVDQYGTYYITYSARDKAGNTATGKRKVVVLHDSEDTRALVAQIASQCGGSISEIRAYVLRHVRYSNSWGGDDPLWYGLTNWSGNCYVHAQVYKALLEYKGYSSRIIHTTDNVHYWNLVYSGGRWWHSDSTPSPRHERMPVLATDDERMATLHAGGNWDRNAYPACP